MGERYDMDHVYYIDGKDWHGCPHYYEYPCVYTWVLLHEYVGIRYSLESDLLIAPKLVDYGTVELASSGIAVTYVYSQQQFILTNTADHQRTFQIDLSALYPELSISYMASGEERIMCVNDKITLAAGDNADFKIFKL
ncbi:MAG: hypothetical protein H7X86_04420 [Gorillibacterium sp.]|nr:hypothetical protein [Gorillibacterium sp.]